VFWVTKSTSVRVHEYQPVRVRCDHCLKPFFALRSRVFEVTVRDHNIDILFSSDEKRATLLDEKVRATLGAERKWPKARAACPKCRYPYPLPHPVRLVSRSEAKVGAAIGYAVLAAIPTLFWFALLAGPLVAPVAGIALGAAFGVVAGREHETPEPRAPAKGPDPLSKDESQFLNDGGSEPWSILGWASEVGAPVGDRGHLVLPVAPVDLASIQPDRSPSDLKVAG
jgi:hypothetical protein